MRMHVLLVSLLGAGCGDFNDEELGLIASAVMHGVEQSRASIEGLDLDYFGSSDLIVVSGEAFTVSGSVVNDCGGSASATGSGKRSSGKLDYTMKLELEGWVLCGQPVQVSGSVDVTVEADDVTATTFRDRPSKARATGKAQARGDGISDDNQDRSVDFELTMTTRAGEAEPDVSGSIDGTDL